MPDIAQLEFTDREVLVALMKAAGLREGVWYLRRNLNVQQIELAGMDGMPFPAVAVSSFGMALVRATGEIGPGVAAIDAATLGMAQPIIGN